MVAVPHELNALTALAALARSLDDLPTNDAWEVAATALSTSLQAPHCALLQPREAGLTVVATRGFCDAVAGSTVDLDAGVIGVAVARRRVIRLAASQGFARYALLGQSGAPKRPSPLPVADDVQSVLVCPTFVGDTLALVLFAESSRPHAFSATTEATFEVLGRLLARRADRPAPAPPRTARANADALVVRCYPGDDSVFVDGAYLIKGLPGRILRWMLEQHVATGRVDFTNRELRLELAATEPWIADNLESRLVLLRRRLAERSTPLTVEHVGRGRLRLAIERTVTLVIEGAASG